MTLPEIERVSRADFPAFVSQMNFLEPPPSQANEAGPRPRGGKKPPHFPRPHWGGEVKVRREGPWKERSRGY